ncbi:MULTISPECIES: helix-turn-helix domain-containing protein [Streptomyces albovinaceus subgroup]|uniref:helix-turn-helix domain-containing protein n=1 Tax=Streptomyces TaxID=1883 RepID=UPI0007C5282E|nr:helix-turn-helix domain-containing protein [Streptomyces mediolani]
MPDEFDWPKRRKRATPEQQELIDAELRKRYDDGTAIRGLMEESGRSYGYIHRRLDASNVTFRPRGGDMRPSRRSADGGPERQPVRDPDALDARRADVGLPLADEALHALRSRLAAGPPAPVEEHGGPPIINLTDTP